MLTVLDDADTFQTGETGADADAKAYGGVHQIEVVQYNDVVEGSDIQSRVQSEDKGADAEAYGDVN